MEIPIFYEDQNNSFSIWDCLLLGHCIFCKSKFTFRKDTKRRTRYVESTELSDQDMRIKNPKLMSATLCNWTPTPACENTVLRNPLLLLERTMRTPELLNQCSLINSIVFDLPLIC